jgi:hypothetical protein
MEKCLYLFQVFSTRSIFCEGNPNDQLPGSTHLPNLAWKMERRAISKLVGTTSFKRRISSCPMSSTFLGWHCYTVHRHSQSLSSDLQKTPG